MFFMIKIESYWLPLRLLDILLYPIMCLLIGGKNDSPQRTHRWNYRLLTKAETDYIDTNKAVTMMPVSASPVYWCGLPVHHLTIFMGWKEYVVLSPQIATSSESVWYVGWLREDNKAVSKLALEGPVRMLLGPQTVSFFALDSGGQQLPLNAVARGRIGQMGPYSRLPLL